MNWDDIANHWKQNKGMVQARWGKLTDNDLAIISGMRNQMACLLQKKYGLAHEQAESEIERFAHNLK